MTTKFVVDGDPSSEMRTCDAPVPQRLGSPSSTTMSLSWRVTALDRPLFFLCCLTREQWRGRVEDAPPTIRGGDVVLCFHLFSWVMRYWRGRQNPTVSPPSSCMHTRPQLVKKIFDPSGETARNEPPPTVERFSSKYAVTTRVEPFDVRASAFEIDEPEPPSVQSYRS